jgi:hypothetical protein
LDLTSKVISGEFKVVVAAEWHWKKERVGRQLSETRELVWRHRLSMAERIARQEKVGAIIRLCY